MTYHAAHLARSIPDLDDLRVPSYKQFPLPLLPIQHESCHLRTRYHLGQGAESGDQLNVFGFVIAEDTDDPVGGTGEQKSLVIFVDEARFIDAAARWIGVGEAGEALIFGPVPDTVITAPSASLPIRAYAPREKGQKRIEKREGEENTRYYLYHPQWPDGPRTGENTSSLAASRC